ncbi:MAG: hypothetical protein IPM29_26560 [Planctomycetes bacterium]|nr:hypothetical protein [Planctomycetota bacterium]
MAIRSVRVLSLAVLLLASACATADRSPVGDWTNVERILDARPGDVRVRIELDGTAIVDLARGLVFPFSDEHRRVFRWRQVEHGDVVVDLDGTSPVPVRRVGDELHVGDSQPASDLIRLRRLQAGEWPAAAPPVASAPR